MIHPRILALFESAAHETTPFPPTILYNEGWLLRLIIDWFSRQPPSGQPLSFCEKARWFSEALLPSAFLARYRGDPLAESRTHLDGVIGHFSIGESGKADFSLWPQATQFVALEAKMFSGLSSGTTNIKYYDQAARNVACIAEVLKRVGRKPSEFVNLGFYVLAPENQIRQGIFGDLVTKKSVQQKVERRVRDYSGEKDQWFRDWFNPTMERISIDTISWEKIIAWIKENDISEGEMIEDFFVNTIKFN